jgi:predicted ester cyclase
MTTTAVDVVRRYLSGHETDVLAPDARMTDHAQGAVHRGPEAIRGVARTMYEETFPGAAARVARLDGTSEMATLEFTFCGSQHGPLGDLPATGRNVEVDMCAVYVVKDDVIASIDLYYDRATMMEQLTAPRMDGMDLGGQS